ncbi:MAG: cytochrome c-type biosis protein [Frankiales bacterium]|jgi:cytochrome c-type biogenesis protein|nr:cytochrome c-type biosis protein [Frankiales bacterium]
MIVLASSIGTSFGQTVTSGSMLLALPVAAIAGLVSFASPCVLPLVPGYLSYVTGMSGADLSDDRKHRGRMLAGSVLFVLGFTAVFVLEGALFNNLTAGLSGNVVVTRVLGALTILLGLAFLGYLPLFSREVRIHRLPRAGLLGAPVLGFVFGLGWAPCIGPTLAAVLNLAYAGGSGQVRSAVLVFAYCLGLGIPFVAVALGLERALGAMTFMRRHSQAIMRFGGALLIVVGLMLVTGWWGSLVATMQQHFPTTGTI